MADGSRFAELALELVGAQAATKFLNDVWEAASPEAKRSLADSVVKRYEQKIMSSDMVFGEVVRDLIRDVSNEHVARIRELAKAKFAERVDREVDEAVKIMAKYANNTIRDLGEEHIRRAVSDALARRPR